MIEFLEDTEFNKEAFVVYLAELGRDIRSNFIKCADESFRDRKRKARYTKTHPLGFLIGRLEKYDIHFFLDGTVHRIADNVDCGEVETRDYITYWNQGQQIIDANFKVGAIKHDIGVVERHKPSRRSLS